MNIINRAWEWLFEPFPRGFENWHWLILNIMWVWFILFRKNEKRR